MKKWLSLLCALIMVLSMLPAAIASADEMVTIKYVIPGSEKEDYATVIEAVNAKLAADLGIQVELIYIPWDVWDQKLNLMLSTGEEFDLFHVMQDRVSFATYYSRGGLADITDALNAYGDGIKASIAPNVLDAATIDGRYYCIPTAWCELGVEGSFTYRADLLKKYGHQVPTTPAEMLDTLEDIISQWDGDETPYLPLLANYNPSSTHLTVLHSQYDSYPFNVVDGLFMVDQEGNVKSWVETEEFKADANWAHEAYERGLIDPDVLTTTEEQQMDKLKRGEYVFHLGTCDYYLDTVEHVPELTMDDIQIARLNSEKCAIRPWAFKNCNAVSSTSKHVNEAVQFINWLYSDQANFDLFFYGIEGQHYTLNDDGSINTLNTNWAFDTWMAGNMTYQRYASTMLPAVKKAQFTVDENAVNSVAGGFFFDASSVQTEYSNVQTEMEAVITPIIMGVISYEDGYESALKRLKDAGLDTVVAEYQRQFNAYMGK